MIRHLSLAAAVAIYLATWWAVGALPPDAVGRRIAPLAFVAFVGALTVTAFFVARDAPKWFRVSVTLAAGPAAARALASAVGVARPRRVGEFDHTTSHRLVKFSVWLSRPLKGRPPARGLWQDLDAARSRGISSAQRRVLELGADAAGVAAAGGMLTP